MNWLVYPSHLSEGVFFTQNLNIDMRKTTRGRNVQHVTGLHKDRNMVCVRTHKGHKAGDLVTIKARIGRAIQHSPNRPSPALIQDSGAHWVHWKDTDAARRRGWSTYGK